MTSLLPDRSSARRGRWQLTLLDWVASIGLIVLTGWNVMRSDSLTQAQRAYDKNSLTIALTRALDHKSRQPWSRQAAHLAALCLSRLDRAEAAEPYYRESGTLSLEDLHVRAFGLVRGNFRERAIKAYEEILERRPNDILALRRLAAVQITQSNDLAVRQIAERLIAIPEGAAIGYTLSGVVHYNAKEHEDAAAAFERVLELDPTLKDMPLSKRLFWNHLTFELLASGRPADARKYLEMALKEYPDAFFMHVLGVAYDIEGEFDEAERCFRQAIEYDSQYSPSFLALGKLELQRKPTEEALKPLLRALELAPENYDVLYNLGLAYRRLGRFDEAKLYQARALAARPPDDNRPEPPKGPLPRYAL